MARVLKGSSVPWTVVVVVVVLLLVLVDRRLARMAPVHAVSAKAQVCLLPKSCHVKKYSWRQNT